VSDIKHTLAKQLRSTMTDAERVLWRQLRAHRLYGAKFRRQQPVGPYIVDFFCAEKKLVIEIDGGQHLNSETDEQRDAWLRSQGYAIMRFWNSEVLNQTPAVLESVLMKLGSLHPLPTPSPLKGEGQ
jgi:very-short-patch-repair endonuclease